jgi:cell envelope opacity-associated protein A
MSQHTPYNIQLQISRMFKEGQAMFASIKVQDWLKERSENPADYNISFNKKPAPPGSREVQVIEIVLQRKDGEPVATWLLEQLTGKNQVTENTPISTATQVTLPVVASFASPPNIGGI